MLENYNFLTKKEIQHAWKYLNKRVYPRFGKEPVSSAGELKVVKGVIEEISRKSGHYTPSIKINNQVIDVLKELNINIQKIKITDGF